MSGFERYLEMANRAKTPDELFDIFVKVLGSYGYDKILFGLLTDHADIGVSAGVGVMENYPSDWMKFYFDNQFDKIDPIVTYGAFQAGAFEWDQIDKHVKLTRKQSLCLALGKEAGLHHGVSVPLRGPMNQMAGMSLASSSQNERPEYNADLLNAFCRHFYTAYRRLQQPVTSNPINAVLTERQRLILTWLALGKSESEIGTIIGCSKHTVNMQLRFIYGKLDAANRTLAITKALTAGLISYKIT